MPSRRWRKKLLSSLVDQNQQWNVFNFAMWKQVLSLKEFFLQFLVGFQIFIVVSQNVANMVSLWCLIANFTLVGAQSQWCPLFPPKMHSICPLFLEEKNSPYFALYSSVSVQGDPLKFPPPLNFLSTRPHQNWPWISLSAMSYKEILYLDNLGGGGQLERIIQYIYF